MSRYGRAQFLKDAARLGVSGDAAFSRTELRRRRDRLMSVHHPDRGGDVGKAQRINRIYARMLAWLDARAERAEIVERPEPDGPVKRAQPQPAGRFRAGSARLWGLAVVAAATYAAIRRKRSP